MSTNFILYFLVKQSQDTEIIRDNQMGNSERHQEKKSVVDSRTKGKIQQQNIQELPPSRRKHLRQNRSVLNTATGDR